LAPAVVPEHARTRLREDWRKRTDEGKGQQKPFGGFVEDDKERDNMMKNGMKSRWEKGWDELEQTAGCL
jgi:hypothetical protein